jgi:hypothetical protein
VYYTYYIHFTYISLYYIYIYKLCVICSGHYKYRMVTDVIISHQFIYQHI